MLRPDQIPAICRRFGGERRDAEGRGLDTVSLFDRRVAAVEVRECGEPLIDLREVDALRLDRRPAGRRDDAPVRLRLGVVDRLVTAQTLLPAGLRLYVARGHHPEPPESPHATGAAVDLTLCTAEGVPLWVGSDPRGARSPHRTVEVSAPDPVAAENRGHLRRAMTVAGFINYPAVWRHWSYGDRYWACVTGIRFAGYGPVRGPGRRSG
ncbi:M15 family metallopeptidase [Streptomyces sp. NPDC058659]|uniref:M15 family metallopeptidase n=1 Tax=unclassified Streptomyces TaxID=2593676 RepID=UPI00365F9324